MTFSVIVVVSQGVENRSRRHVLQQCFQSLLNQNFPKSDFEIILVDSGSGLSKDDWQEFIQRADSVLVALTVFQGSEGNIGPARARNFGVEMVSLGKTKMVSEVVAFTDDDTTVARDWLERLDQALSQSPQAAGAGGLTLPTEAMVRKNIFAADEEYLYRRYFPDDLGDLPRLRAGQATSYRSRKVLEHPVFSGNIAYRRDIFESVGGFNPSFEPGIYGEDADLKNRVLEKGGFLVFVPVVNEHWGVYNFERFRRQQESRGRGIVKFRSDHHLYPQTKTEIYLRLILSPLTFLAYSLSTGFNLRLAFLESLGYFFRQKGKLGYHRLGLNPEEPKERKLKILFADHTPLVGGAQLALLRHLKYLDLSQFKPMVAIEGDGPMVDRFKNLDQIEIWPVHFPKLKTFNPFAWLGFLKAAVYLIFKSLGRKPDLLVANTERAFYLLFLVALILRKKLVLIVRDFEFSQVLLKLTAFKTDRYFCVSQSIARFYSLSGPKTTIIYVGSDFDQKLNRVNQDEADDVAVAYGIKPGSLVIGFVGRLVEWKGARVLVEAFGELIKKNFDSRLELVLVGEGPLRAELEELSLRQGTGKLIHFVGQVKDTEIWYKVFAIFVLPSVAPEPLATTVIEAGLSGLPIVATATGGTPEFIEDDQNGLLVEPNRLEMVAAISKLVTDSDLRRRLGQAARRRALAGFTEQEVTGKMVQVYKNL